MPIFNSIFFIIEPKSRVLKVIRLTHHIYLIINLSLGIIMKNHTNRLLNPACSCDTNTKIVEASFIKNSEKSKVQLRYLYSNAPFLNELYNNQNPTKP